MGGSHCFPSTVFPTCSSLEGGFFLIVVQTPTVPVAKPRDSSTTAMIFVVVPTLVFFLSSLKGSRGADKAWGLPPSRCLTRQAWGSPSAACALSLPVLPPTNVLITRGQKIHRVQGQLTRRLPSKCSPLDPALLCGFAAFYKLSDVALITRVGEILLKRIISLHFSFL